MDLEYALRYPVLTIGSGPANSIRGAAYLTGSTDAIVVDVGGTSADVGVLVNGFPRESSSGVEIGVIQDELPDAGPGDHRGRGWHDRARRRRGGGWRWGPQAWAIT